MEKQSVDEKSGDIPDHQSIVSMSDGKPVEKEPSVKSVGSAPHLKSAASVVMVIWLDA